MIELPPVAQRAAGTYYTRHNLVIKDGVEIHSNQIVFWTGVRLLCSHRQLRRHCGKCNAHQKRVAQKRQCESD